MISRIMLSLRKVADEQQSAGSLGVTTGTNFPLELEFTRPRGEGDIPLATRATHTTITAFP